MNYQVFLPFFNEQYVTKKEDYRPISEIISALNNTYETEG